MISETKQNIIDSGFGKRLLKEACEYCIPLFWCSKNDDSWPVENNGTAFLIDCGKGVFLVTAAHVYESYLKRISEKADIWPQLEDITFRMEERVIGYVGSQTLDIATFKISSDEITFLNRRILIGSDIPYNAPIAKIGENALFAGVPGLQRTYNKDSGVGFGFFASFNPISSVSERQFGCAFDRSKWVDVFGKGMPDDGYDLGGISGAPVLIVEESNSGILSWRLGGVIYNASNVLGEIILAHHAKYITVDGKIDLPNH